jgi:hypothetical protein
MSIKLIDLLRELSATGTGATAVPGEGEGMATKYAFAGPGGTKAKRKKGLIVKKEMEEAVGSPDSSGVGSGRPRTVNIGADNPFDAKYGAKYDPEEIGEKPKDNSFLPGAVYLIDFVDSHPKTHRVKTEGITVYRKINDKDVYDRLVRSKTMRHVYRSNKPDQEKDIYYINIPRTTLGGKRIIGSKSKIIKYYLYLTKEGLEKIKDDIGKYIEFEQVPIEDIINNKISANQLNISSLATLIDIEDFKKGQATVDRQKKISKEKEPEDSTPKKLTKFSTIRSGADYARIILNQDREKSLIDKSKSELKGLQGERLAKKLKSLLTIELRKDGLDKEEIEMKFDDPVFIQNVLTPVQKYANIPINEATAELQSLPSGNDPISIAKKAFILLKNKLFGLTFDECLEDPTTISNLLDKMEKAKNSIKNEQKKITDDDIYEELENVIVGISSMQNITDDLKKAFEQANKSDFNINYNK